MDRSTLVDSQIKAGRRLLEFLDGEEYPVASALWYYYPDTDDWKLIIGTKRARENLTTSYAEFSRLLSEFGDNGASIDLSQVKLLSPDDQFLKTLSTAIRVEGISEVRFSKNRINNIYFDDALIYRSAA